MGLHAGRVGSVDSTWQLWHDFCTALHQDAYLQTHEDPIPLLCIFARRYRSGEIAPKGAPVRSRMVENALRAIGQTLATLGLPDPRLMQNGKLDLRLQRQLKAYKKRPTTNEGETDTPANHCPCCASMLLGQYTSIDGCGRHAHPRFLLPPEAGRVCMDRQSRIHTLPTL
jgi:hypothetical protein